jgi:O-antigen/teichoic acid export membrane protein
VARAPARGSSSGSGPLHHRVSLRVSFGWTLAGNVVNAASQWAVLVLIARLVNREGVGQFALASAATTPVFLLTGLHLRSAIATDAAGSYAFSDYLGVRCGGALAALAGTAVVLAVAGYSPGTSVVVLALALTKAADAIVDIFHGLLQQHERMRPIANSLMARSVLTVVALGGVLWAGGGLALAVLAFTVASIVVFFGYDVPNATGLLHASEDVCRPRLRGRAAKAIVALSLPLGFVNLALSLRTYLPRFFIESRFGTAELGVFAALSSFVVLGTLVVSALGQSCIPRLARQFHMGDLAGFRRLVGQLLFIGAGVGGTGIAVAAFAGGPILRAVFGSEYAGRVDVLVWLMGVGLLSNVSSFLGYALNAARRFTVQLPLFVATALACAGACRWTIPTHGLVGAAWAWGGALLVEAVACWILLELALRRRAARGTS